MLFLRTGNPKYGIEFIEGEEIAQYFGEHLDPELDYMVLFKETIAGVYVAERAIPMREAIGQRSIMTRKGKIQPVLQRPYKKCACCKLERKLRHKVFRRANKAYLHHSYIKE